MVFREGFSARLKRVRFLTLHEWLQKYGKSLLVMLFVATSLLLIAFISLVAWTYYTSMLPQLSQTMLVKSKEDFVVEDKIWQPLQDGELENSLHDNNRPMFVHSKSSELNFDELENTNVVNSDLMHDSRFDNDEVNTNNGDLLSTGEYRNLGGGKTTTTTMEVENTKKQYFLPLQNPKPTIKNTIDESADTRQIPNVGDSSEETLEMQPMTMYKVDKAVKAGAVCLDGSPPAYYHRPGVGPSERLWIIHFNGGAWCFDKKACIERSRSSLGSTNKLPKSPPIIQGINSPNPTVNPDFYDWNLVWIVYCDGASFSGNRERPVISSGGDTIYMRGKRVINAILNDLLFNRNFKSAESIILTGSSAGSMAAIFQADYIASKFSDNIPIKVLADAGYFIDTAPIGGKNLAQMFKKIYEMQEASAGLNQDCVKSLGTEAWKCFLPAVATQYVKTPIFYLNSAYDIWSLIYFLGIDCKFPVLDENKRKKRSNVFDGNILGRSDSELNLYVEDTDKLQNNELQSRSGKKDKRDVSGYEMRPFFREYFNKGVKGVKKAISSIVSAKHNHKKVMNRTIYDTDKVQTHELQSRHTKIYKRDVSGYEMRPFFRNYFNKSVKGVKKAIKSIVSAKLNHKKVMNKTADGRSVIANISKYTASTDDTHTTLRYNLNNNTHHTSDDVVNGTTSRNNTSIVVITMSNTADSTNNTTNVVKRFNVTVAQERLKKNKIERPSDDKVFMDSLKSIESLLPNQMKTLSRLSDENINEIHQQLHSVTIDSKKFKSETSLKEDKKTVSEKKSVKNTMKDSLKAKQGQKYIKASKNYTKSKTKSIPSTISKLSSMKANFNSSNTKQLLRNNSISKIAPSKKATKRHSLKKRRSTSIAREYINILRSDPPECTETDIDNAMKYREEILKKTDRSMVPNSSGRFLVSCIDHSMSLFDETWTGIRISGKSIQEAFGDWFYDRVPKNKSNFVDCPYPCNQSCP